MNRDWTVLKKEARARVLAALRNSRTLTDMYQRLKNKKKDELVVRELFQK